MIGHSFNNCPIQNQRELHRFLAPWVQEISQRLGYEFWVDDQEELFPPTLRAHQFLLLEGILLFHGICSIIYMRAGQPPLQ